MSKSSKDKNELTQGQLQKVAGGEQNRGGSSSSSTSHRLGRHGMPKVYGPRHGQGG